MLPQSRPAIRPRALRPAGCLAARGRGAFTLVELLVVMAIIGVLVGAVLTASSVLVNQQRTRNTRTVLTIVRDAVDQFANEQTSNPTVVKRKLPTGPTNVSYASRYGNYPPDELEPFSPYGMPGSEGKLALVDVTKQRFFPNIDTGTRPGAMRFYKTGVVDDDALEHRDLAAMVLSIQLFSEGGRQLLERLPERNRVPVPARPGGIPLQFLDRVPFDAFEADRDETFSYIVDDWGIPLSYMSQRNWDEADPPPESGNHPEWNEASSELVRLNGGKPLIFSYGPDGKEQLSKDFMEPPGAKTPAQASLIGDFETNGHKIANPLNKDNVYIDAHFHEKLAEGIVEEQQ